jgi:hypothetical protein
MILNAEVLCGLMQNVIRPRMVDSCTKFHQYPFIRSDDTSCVRWAIFRAKVGCLMGCAV